MDPHYIRIKFFINDVGPSDFNFLRTEKLLKCKLTVVVVVVVVVVVDVVVVVVV